MKKRRAYSAAAVLSVGALALSACSSGNGGGGSDNPSSGSSTAATTAKVQAITVGTAADSVGPAPAVAGAKKGGTAIDLEPAGINHLDPAEAYVNQEQVIGQLFSRQLTNYKIDPTTGKTVLVGDLATDTGTSSDGGKTWTFHLKDGLKWQDGTPITSDQVKYGIERLFSSFETAGPQYVQQWLTGSTDFRKVYGGPQGGKSLPDSVLATPDDKTIVFHFKAPHADAPYAMALSGSGPILKAKDTGPKYDTAPFSDGPYVVSSYKPGKALELTRNKYWDPKTDPIRGAFPDKWDIQLGVEQPGLTQRLEQQSDSDKNAVSLVQSADPTQMSVLAGSQYKSRLESNYQPFVDVFNINVSRITNVKVRQAIIYAFPMQQVQTALGGPQQGELGTNLIGPTVSGFKASDPYGKLTKPLGDPEKAKQLLKEAGVKDLHLSFAYSNSGQRWANVATTLKNSFAKAGITLDAKAIDPTAYYTLIGKKDNPYDLYRTGWGSDWPNASTVIPPTQDGRLIADDDPNYSHLNDPKVNTEIDRISKITDLNQQAAEWQTLAETIMKTDAPSIPYLYDKYYNIYGEGLGGVSYNSAYGTINPNTIYVK
ncbi:ABC transporter substrate-binding protein [Streptomyces sp. NBC_00448]|uniref:ABC transporter substrate-binding protein n=1 Tax=Streptomyces sp. NBC_00448 TaxID=2903652 RepID=UPI002E1F8FDF